MKYTIIGNNNYKGNVVDEIFINRGVRNKDSLLELDESVCNHFSKLENIEFAIDCLLRHVNEENEIFVQVDPDCDGYSSSAALINYLTDAFPQINIKWYLPEGKEHGVKLETVPDSTKLVIIPDSGTNQFEEHKALKLRGIDVIVIDHHECDRFSKDAIVVNNQLSPMFSNKNLSGVGIVYKFCQALDSRLNIQSADNYLDLVAIGNIGDMMDLREPETRYYVKKGLEKVMNPFLKELVIKQDYAMKSTLNIHNVGFYISPLINACVRYGTLEDKRNMMKSFLGYDEQIYYKKKDVYEPIQVATARNVGNLRNRQNKARDKSTEKIIQIIEEEKLNQNKLIVVNVTGILDKTLTGLVANNIAKTYKRPTLLIRQKEDDDKLLGGSARGYEKGCIKNLREFLISTGKFEFCEGHSNSFGLEIKEDKLTDLQAAVDNLLKGVDVEDSNGYDVDFEIPQPDVESKIITEIASYKNEWGSVLSEPLLVFNRIPIDALDVFLLGKRKDTLKLKYKGIEFIKFFFKEEQYNKYFSEGTTFYLNILGKCSFNEWDGKITPQVEIVDFELTDTLYF